MADARNVETLSRAVSAIDLQATLTEVQNRSDVTPRYTNDQLLRLNPENEKDRTQVEVEEVEDPDGLKTPPAHGYYYGPEAPPPTPASPAPTDEERDEKYNDGSDEELPPYTPFDNAKNENIKPVEHDDKENIKPVETKEEPAGSVTTVTPEMSKEGSPENSNPAKPKLLNEPIKEKDMPKRGPPVKGPKKAKAPRVSGFEDYYADAPITPEEHEEEQDIYEPSKPFHERMQTCIQRYRARRKLNEKRLNLLLKYLALGGVETTPKAFTGGLDKETLENATADEIAAINATDFIRMGGGQASAKYYDGSDNWVVDFEGIARGFFSWRLPSMFSTETQEDISLACATIRNFLNYILQHSVCTEYTADVLAARSICNLAESELYSIRQLQVRLPGTFNVAASTLFGGRYEGRQDGLDSWLPEEERIDMVNVEGMTILNAKRVFETAMALTGSEEAFQKALQHETELVKSERRFVEVVSIARASQETLNEYAQVVDTANKAGNIKALGVITVKPWEGPHLEPVDCTDSEDEEEIKKIAEGKTEELWFEDEMLPFFFEGMKMEVSIRELNVGVKYADVVWGCFCSFFWYLPQEKMTGWKEPALNPRPAPSVDDPDVEEKALEKDFANDLDDVEKDFAT